MSIYLSANRRSFSNWFKTLSSPKLLVDVTERSLEQQIDYIADWLEATGALIQQKRHQIVKLCYALILQ
jgi:transcriptional antiterminator